jgi:hypothetical protein
MVLMFGDLPMSFAWDRVVDAVELRVQRASSVDAVELRGQRASSVDAVEL